jgi:hypothetical protein
MFLACAASVRWAPTDTHRIVPLSPARLPDNTPPTTAHSELHLGAAQIAVLWRLTKEEVASRAIVMDDANGMRLVVVEGERIVQWERFRLPSELRTRAGAIQTQRRRNGWS